MKIEITSAPNLTTNGFVKTGSSNGTLSVDSETYLPLSGGTMSGDLSMGGNDISNVSTIEIGSGATDTTLSRLSAGVLGVEGIAVPTVSSTNTLTNKRVTKRVTSITSSATPTINTDNCDAVTITALATAITSMTTNLSGTPSNFDELIIRIKDDGTARAITWGASFTNHGAILPTTTTVSKTLTIKFIHDSVAAKWGCVAAVEEA